MDDSLSALVHDVPLSGGIQSDMVTLLTHHGHA